MRLRFRLRGFTMIELVVVLIVLAIVSTVIVSRVGSFDTRATTQASALRAHLRHVQSRALKSGNSWGMRCAGTEYWMFQGTNPVDAAAERPLPGEDAMHVDLTDKGVTISAFTVIFDGYGIPYSSAGVAQATNLIITLQAQGNAASTDSLTVIPETGYVQ